MPKMAGLLEEMYSWHMDPFFQPKKSTNCSVEEPASATLVAAVLLNEWAAFLKVDLRIYLLKLLPAFLIGLPACRLDLLKNLLIRKILLLHIAIGDSKHSEVQTITDR